MTAQATIREEDGQYVGQFSIESAPNQFIRNLVTEALSNGTATALDAEGCAVTAVAEVS